MMTLTHLATLMTKISSFYLTIAFGGLSTDTQLYLLNSQKDVDGTELQDAERDSHGTD